MSNTISKPKQIMYHGKLYTTPCGSNLDEAKSLLQKGLRRKDEQVVAQSYKELKDRLSWGSLLIYLFEDHCLVSLDQLHNLYGTFQKKDKQQFLKKLLEVRSCRVAACLFVYIMSNSVNVNYDLDIEIPEYAQGLIDQTYNKYKHLNANLVISQFLKAWNDGNAENLIFFGKLINMIAEIEKSDVTIKGKDLIDSVTHQTRNYHASITHVMLALLYKFEKKDMNLKKFIYICLKFCFVSDSNTRKEQFQRLILSTVIAQRIHNAGVNQTRLPPSQLDWNAVPALQVMPDYAVDKHTFRGKKGCSTMKYKEQGSMSDSAYESFHGHRPQRDIHYFLTEGCLITEPSLEENPYWEITKETYLSQPLERRKTALMTPYFYEKLFQTKKDLFITVGGGLQDLPLMQQPTGIGKVYTRMDLKTEEVVKGPYSDAKFKLVMKFHKQMQQLGDRHTLAIREDYPFIRMKLIRDKSRNIVIHEKMWYDPIKKIKKEDHFVDRETLGVSKLSGWKKHEIFRIPLSVVLHFAFRYALNIGDSGLPNCISCGDDIYGIDMEEIRGWKKRVDGKLATYDESLFHSVCDFLFSTSPRVGIRVEIDRKVKNNKHEFIQNLCDASNRAKLFGLDNSVVIKLEKLKNFVQENL